MNGQREIQKPDPKLVKELWDYVTAMVARERAARTNQAMAQKAREKCWTVLCDQHVEDGEAIERVKGIIRHHGLAD